MAAFYFALGLVSKNFFYHHPMHLGIVIEANKDDILDMGFF